MSRFIDKLFSGVFFVEGCVIHDNNALRGELRQQVLFNPTLKGLAIDCAFKKANGK